ncbi:hypothetical protein [Anaerosinus massiliensis]|uniref:hypothetical protein n=1 Tax=Massilibacillus massiliensis TaxID=1806837 RepID=UPI000DA63DD2|nr:hypothetical protein [Massilibacillus massiliensis]
MENNKERSMFTAKEAITDYFEGTISYQKLLQDFHAGLIPGKQVSSKRILFKREALDKWFDEGSKERPKSSPTNFYKVNMF